MDSTDDTPLDRFYGHECREERGEATPAATLQQAVYDTASDQVMRAQLLDGLDKLEADVQHSCDNCLTEDGAAFRLRLQIHRERCALLGLGYAIRGTG